MRVVLAAICLTASVALASAQAPEQAPDQSVKSPDSTGRSVSPETEGKQQPQGKTGPVDTTQGGAPAHSPQGQTPPGMQAAPDGSSKTIVEPKSSEPNRTAKDTVPPATDKSEATRAGAQEPSAKIEGTATGAFERGTLTAPGALTDVDTAPAKFSARTAADDALPIAAYTLKHLTDDQRRAILASVGREGSVGPKLNADFANVGALVPTAVALSALQPLPDSVTASIPGMNAVRFAKVAEKIVLANPRTRVVIGVLEP
jgi:hypothetical protein